MGIGKRAPTLASSVGGCSSTASRQSTMSTKIEAWLHMFVTIALSSLQTTGHLQNTGKSAQLDPLQRNRTIKKADRLLLHHPSKKRRILRHLFLLTKFKITLYFFATFTFQPRSRIF